MNKNEISFPKRNLDSYFAKDKKGVEHQFTWSFDNKLFINKDGKGIEVNENDYEIIQN